MATTQTTPFADRALCTLSGGEAQRVHLAAALAQEPKVLLLDEPTAALDLYHQLSIFTMLRDLSRHEGLGVVVVTHDLNLAARYCSHVLLLDDGRTVASGPPADVIVPGRLEPVYLVKLAEAAVNGGRWVVPVETTEGGA
jgi:iron complex transport system ATP-binding protein